MEAELPDDKITKFFSKFNKHKVRIISNKDIICIEQY